MNRHSFFYSIATKKTLMGMAWRVSNAKSATFTSMFYRLRGYPLSLVSLMFPLIEEMLINSKELLYLGKKR